ncbi:MAG: bifunctional ornithine acetyltransferase/N-acetylglutamate synthase, partial [Pseudomonadota bacterium]
MPAIEGVRLATAAAGVKYRDRTDVMLAVLSPGTVVAGTFTRSATRSAPVLDCERKIGIASDAGAAIVVNSGNANAFTGRAGDASVAEICRTVADVTGVPEARVFTASTGVIGERLPHGRIQDAVTGLAAEAGTAGFDTAARAIMTTDTYPKGAWRQAGGVTIAGIAMGSGMIAPDMATMLVYIFTDAAISQAALQGVTAGAVAHTFNRITVDSDTSTSDTLLVAA